MMKIVFAARIAIAVLFLGVLVPATPLLAQTRPQELQIEDFSVIRQTDASGRDISFMIQYPSNPQVRGTVAGIGLWACGGDSAGLSGASLYPCPAGGWIEIPIPFVPSGRQGDPPPRR
jgi:hypothetical protein